jgi:hypothetical protein
MDAGTDKRPPRGALVVVAVGLIATLAAAWLATDKPLGSAAQLSWVAKHPLPDSEPAAVPGGGRMQLGEAGMRATDPNISGYRLYRVTAVLTIDARSAVGQGRVRCRMQVPRPPRTLVTHTPGSRASYPRSTGEGKELLDQGDVPETVLVEFNSHGTELASLDFGDVFDNYTTIPGVTVSWGTFREGVQVWQWSLPKGRPTEPVVLGFGSIWRTTGAPAARISCAVTTSSGTATVGTRGELTALPAPVPEEATEG